MSKIILKSVVGSRAHGLATETSDMDLRGIFLNSTSQMLSLGSKPDQTNWIEGETDDTSYELGKFLMMATKSNATVLEILHGPVVEMTSEGQELKELFPYMWSSHAVLDAFRGYSLNQRKKFLEDKDGRAFKYACHYIRILLLGIELLTFETMTPNVVELEVKLRQINIGSSQQNLLLYFGSFDYNLSLRDVLLNIKSAQYSRGLIIDFATYLDAQLIKAYDRNPNHINDLNIINHYLLKVRKDNW